MKKLILSVLVIMFFASVLLPGFAAETKIDLFGSEAAADGSRYKNTDEGWIGYKFNVSQGKLVGVVIPSWYDAPSSSVIILYRWNSDYNTSVQSGPIYTGVIEDNGSGWVDPGQRDHYVKFDRAFAEGDYLLVIQRKEDRALHVPTRSAFSGAIAFLEGDEIPNLSFQLSVLVDSAAQLNETPNITYQLGAFKKALYGAGASIDGKSNIMINEYDIVGHSFTVSGGSFTGFIINDIGVQNSGKFQFNLYKWNTDYATSKAGTPVFSGEYTCQQEASGFKNFEIVFDKALPQGQYLVTISSDDNIFFWTHNLRSGVTSYLDGTAYDSGTLKLSFMADPNIEPEVDEPETQNPETGDSSSVFVIFAVVAVLSLVGMKKKIRV